MSDFCQVKDVTRVLAYIDMEIGVDREVTGDCITLFEATGSEIKGLDNWLKKNDLYK